MQPRQSWDKHAEAMGRVGWRQAGVPGRFGPRSIHLSSESPLSFPLGAPGPGRGGVSDAMDAAIRTDLPAHSHPGPPCHTLTCLPLHKWC